MRIYFAGPLFSQAERRFNLDLTDRLESLGFEVFLPQRDAVERDRPRFDRMSPEERGRAIFEIDRDEILRADVFLFVLDGRVPDEGACVELGIAYAHRHLTGVAKTLIGLQTDVRAAFLGSRLNPMVRVPLDHDLQSEAQLIEVLEALRARG